MDPTAKPRAVAQQHKMSLVKHVQTYQNRDPSAKSMHLWSINPHKAGQVHTLGGRVASPINGIEKIIAEYGTPIILYSLKGD